MTLTCDSPVIAVDGGGTRCRLALAAGAHTTRIEIGPTNVTTNFDAAVGAIVQGTDKLAQEANISPSEVLKHPAYLGLAGVTGAGIAKRLEAALPFQHMRIADDRPSALRGALADSDGVLAHCGTGSFFGAQNDRKIRFAGGWGPVLGDEASAYWVGRHALSVSVTCTDGTTDMSPMSQHFLSKFEGSPGIVAFAATASQSELAALAADVTEFAAQGDANAARILKASADHISKMAVQLGWQPGTAFCLTGGIGPHFLPYLPEQLRLVSIAPKSEPLDGAISLAQEFRTEIQNGRD